MKLGKIGGFSLTVEQVDAAVAALDLEQHEMAERLLGGKENYAAYLTSLGELINEMVQTGNSPEQRQAFIGEVVTEAKTKPELTDYLQSDAVMGGRIMGADSLIGQLVEAIVAKAEIIAP